MFFERLIVNQLRCFERLEYAPGSGLNLVCGPNGSGKTTVLEGFAIASLGLFVPDQQHRRAGAERNERAVGAGRRA